MKKKILFLFLVLLLTGCKADYNLKINLGGNVIESGSIYIESSLLGKGNNSSDYNVFLEDLLKKSGADVYRTTMKIKKSNYVGVLFYHRYNSLSGYTNLTPAIRLLYDSVYDTNTNGYVQIHSSDKSKISEYHNPTSDVPSRVEGFEISISLPYKVVKNNATKVDSVNNTYTWVLLPGMSNDNIILEYRENEFYTTNPLYLARFVDLYIYIAIALVLIILLVIAMIKSKLPYVNKL